jgi:hypothetical protein
MFPVAISGNTSAMVAAGAGPIALDVGGALIVITAIVDMFMTIFNYDGYTTLATLFHRGWWRVIRFVTRPLPTEARHVALSLGSASMLPATVALWLGLEITGFALLYDSTLGGGAFTLKGATPTVGTAFYLSAGAISSLSFGDVIARGSFDRALVDLETIFGLATFTLALGYVVTTFGVLGALENLHGRVRRHAEDPDQPSSILARHFRGGQPSDLPSFLQSLGDDLEGYDQGLRRYPVVYYFHTRRTDRSIPHIFSSLGYLLSLLRWGLPPGEQMTEDPFLTALLSGYERTLHRLRRSFVGPDPLEPPAPLPPERFAAAYDAPGTDVWVDGFRRLQERARAASGIEETHGDAHTKYERYSDWLPFAYARRAVLDRVADRLGYERPKPG